MPDLRLTTDVGGTFTDTVLTDADGMVLATTKTLTTHDNPALATNAMLERRGARVATLTTEGFRDILDIAYERRYSQYDISLTKLDYIVPRDRALTVP